MSVVFRTIDPPPPSPPSEYVLSPHQRGGDTHSPGGEGVGGGSIFRKTPDIGLASYNKIPLRISPKHKDLVSLCSKHLLLSLLSLLSNLSVSLSNSLSEGDNNPSVSAYFSLAEETVKF